MTKREPKMPKRAGTRDDPPARDRQAGDVADRLLRYYDERRRDLPWRRDNDPYRVWVSEVMLQQTRVETVIPYYERWLRRFPSLDHLAEASLDDVFLEWQGLGYYSRARNLHAAARVVRERFGGRVPESPETLRGLPGVGEYTAGALASIAFGLPEPAIDGNTRRVLSRLFDLERPTAPQLRAHARDLIPEQRPGDFNQALMELGATLCTPRKPHCRRCPLNLHCLAHGRGTVETRPAPRKRVPVPRFDVGVAAVIAAGRYLLLVRREDGGLLGGLWSLPGAEVRAGESPRAAAAGAARKAGVRVLARNAEPLGSVPHAFSHRREIYHVHRFAVSRLPDPDPDARATWVETGALDTVALPAAQRRIAGLLSTPPSARPRSSSVRHGEHSPR